MTDRKAMDRPAAVTALGLGILLIVVSALLLTLGGGGANTYTVSWAQSEATAATGQNAPAGQAATVTAQVTDVFASNVTLSITCNDNRGTGGLAAAATVTWTLRSASGETLGSGTDCPSNFQVALLGHPDVAQVEADSAEDALEQVLGQAATVTDDYIVEFTWNRAGTTGPLPIPPQGTSFSATIALSVQQWDATVNEQTAEDLR